MNIISDSGKHKIESVGTLQEVAPAIRYISKRAFRNRLTPPVRKLIRESTDDIVIDMKEELEITEYVDLDLISNEQALLYLEYMGILAEGQGATILVDGTPDEEYIK